MRHLYLARHPSGWSAKPLESLTVLTTASDATLHVRDGLEREYFRTPATPETTFLVGGALGTHTITLTDSTGHALDTISFPVAAHTGINDDTGRCARLLNVLHKTLCCYSPTGKDRLEWRGRKYECYVPWILDHCHTAKGMQYFDPATGEFVDLLAQAQRADGMIWSNAFRDTGPGYLTTAYGYLNCAWRDGGLTFSRQPAENHCEYNFVEALYLTWKGSGDRDWLQARLPAAVRALDFSVADPLRWSTKFQLLKRPYTIDSWDFQADDEYLPKPEGHISHAMCVHPGLTKFTIFFGDNTGYALACDQLAEMLTAAGQSAEAERFRIRAAEIRTRLDQLAWNGRFYTHHIEEDPAVVRKIGVPEDQQLAMSNAYALNRNITHAQAVAILESYLNLKQNLPHGSPGEWYAVYPPYHAGFGHDNRKWQYMNAGVHGHAAGELARGAFEHGYEAYGVDLLDRLLALGEKHGYLRFAYTGGWDPPPPPANFTPVSLSAYATMDLTDEGAKDVPAWMGGETGNDLRNLPVGRQTLADIPWTIADPAANNRRAILGVSTRHGLPSAVQVPIHAAAGAFYLLHTVGGVSSAGIAAAITFDYADGSQATQYLQQGQHLTGWWFPELKGPNAGIAWVGTNPRSDAVGLCWCALANPHPAKVVRSLTFTAALDGATYALAALTLADRMPYTPAGPLSTGGPDNWSGGTICLALMEGLVGVRATSPAFQTVRLSPRWAAAGVSEVTATTHYPASGGYVAYRFRHDPAAKAIEITLTGSGQQGELRILLPANATRIRQAQVAGVPVSAALETIEKSHYAVFTAILLTPPTHIKLLYD